MQFLKFEKYEHFLKLLKDIFVLKNSLQELLFIFCLLKTAKQNWPQNVEADLGVHGFHTMFCFFMYSTCSLYDGRTKLLRT